jgi:glucose/arabinose dehydrogenase
MKFAALSPVLTLVFASGAFAQYPYSANNLPAPFATSSTTNRSEIVERPAGAQLKVPAGFTVEEYMGGFKRPRTMILGPSKELVIADTAFNNQGAVYVVPAGSKEKKVLIDGMNAPFGLAFWKDYLYVGEPESIKRFKYDAKTMTVTDKGQEVVSLKGLGNGHNTRNILFDRKGEKMYIAVGSGSNVDAGEDPVRAALNRYNPDGTGHEIFVSGTRNPVGLHLKPGSDEIWISVQERDLLGDDLVPDYFTHIEQNRFYGWPNAYIGSHPDPRREVENKTAVGKALVDKAVVPDVLLPAHAGVLDFAFYTGNMFPAEYKSGAFISYHGSWNRALRHGYEVRFQPFKNGKPDGAPKEFLTGWMIAADVKGVWGRPVGIVEMPDGSILVSDDGGNKIWRVSYKK